MTEQSIFERGVSKVKGVVSDLSIEQRDFSKAFIAMCSDGYARGWHESNGGNLSYRLSAEELQSCRSYFNEVPGQWVPLGIRAEGLQSECLMISASGGVFRTIEKAGSKSLGIIEISPEGDAWRAVWGFKGGGWPSSELRSHFMIHAVRKAISGGADRVVYHTHPENVIALSTILPADTKQYTQIIWRCLTESILMAPSGVGVGQWRAPGSAELAEETATLMEKHLAVIWPHHGLLCAGTNLDAAFGLTHTIDKAAGIYLKARSAVKNEEALQMASEENVRAAAQAFGVSLDETFLG